MADEESTVFSPLTGQALDSTAETSVGGRLSFKRFNKTIEGEANYSSTLLARSDDMTAEEIEAKLLHNRQKQSSLLDKQAASAAGAAAAGSSGGSSSKGSKQQGQQRFSGSAGRFAGFKKLAKE